MGPRAAFRRQEVLTVGLTEVVLPWRLELERWAGGPSAKPVVAFLSRRRW